MDKMAQKVTRMTWSCLHLKQICLQVKISQMKNVTFHILFFQISLSTSFFIYLSKKYHEDIYFLEEFKKQK